MIKPYNKIKAGVDNERDLNYEDAIKDYKHNILIDAHRQFDEISRASLLVYSKVINYGQDW